MDDSRLLRALLEAPGLTPDERDAFEGMRARLPRYSCLTDRQRLWAQGVGARLGLGGVQAPGQALGPAPGRAAWDPSKRTRRMSAGKLEAYAADLSEEIRAIERRKARARARRSPAW